MLNAREEQRQNFKLSLSHLKPNRSQRPVRFESLEYSISPKTPIHLNKTSNLKRIEVIEICTSTKEMTYMTLVRLSTRLRANLTGLKDLSGWLDLNIQFP